MREYVPIAIEVISHTLINGVFIYEGKKVISPYVGAWVAKGKEIVYGCDDRAYQFYIREDDFLRKFEGVIGDVFFVNKLIDDESGKSLISKITSRKDSDGKLFFDIEFKNGVSPKATLFVSDESILELKDGDVLPEVFTSGRPKELFDDILVYFKNAIE